MSNYIIINWLWYPNKKCYRLYIQEYSKRDEKGYLPFETKIVDIPEKNLLKIGIKIDTLMNIMQDYYQNYKDLKIALNALYDYLDL